MAGRCETGRRVVHTHKIVQYKALDGGGAGRLVGSAALGITHSPSVRRANVLPAAVLETSWKGPWFPVSNGIGNALSLPNQARA
jgi:hypothetical protein